MEIRKIPAEALLCISMLVVLLHSERKVFTYPWWDVLFSHYTVPVPCPHSLIVLKKIQYFIKYRNGWVDKLKTIFQRKHIEIFCCIGLPLVKYTMWHKYIYINIKYTYVLGSMYYPHAAFCSWRLLVLWPRPLQVCSKQQVRQLLKNCLQTIVETSLQRGYQEVIVLLPF